ncbi:hypothetical protein JNUCC1_00942 [Lentibacillus sp. JNUCC-1]|uniref:hypothetical protein n=1 Tax=Lentibacillus sp. JNUCC-1 TaxID=2654513 RepID=UPI0012E7EC9F|nr:hypothetical protein [Lentibacillus sp. JNUCC-1]MUV37136.1 hypothetical protein [Lentibacillus sp. JNUCC-1]
MRKVYYSERSEKIDIKLNSIRDLKDLFVQIHEDLARDLYFRELYGNQKSNIDGIAGSNIEAFAFEKTRIRNLMPIDYNKRYKEHELFTLIELLHDYVSECKWDDFEETWMCNKEKGQRVFRDRINSILNIYDQGWELSTEGYIREWVNNGLGELIEAQYDNSDDEQYTEIQEAKKQFLRYGSTIDDKRSALLQLGRVMENVRREMTQLLPEKPDTEQLFHILNKYNLRHNNPNQHKDYDREIYYRWMFFIFLSAIDAYFQMKD